MFLHFWLRYVWPNLADLELERVEEVWARRVEPDLATYVAMRAERSLIPLLAQAPLREWLGFSPSFVGRYWDPAMEIDLVALDAERRTAGLCEVKWSTRPVGVDVARTLRAKAAAVPELSGCRCRFVLFSRSGFTSELARTAPEDLRLVDLRTFKPG